MSIVLRKAEKRDAQDLEELFYLLLNEHTDLDKLSARVEEVYIKDNYYLAVAYDTEVKRVVGSTMGIICYDFCKDCANFMVIENVIVSEACRGKGVGRKLFALLEDWAKENDCSYSLLVASDDRKMAHKFYQSMGFKEEKGFRKWYGEQYD